MLSASTQPSRNSGPLTRARRENSTRITAMMPAGLIATPAPNVSTSPIPWPMASASPDGEGRCGGRRRAAENTVLQRVERLDGDEGDDRRHDDERGEADSGVRDQDERDHDRRKRQSQDGRT